MKPRITTRSQRCAPDSRRLFRAPLLDGHWTSQRERTLVTYVRCVGHVVQTCADCSFNRVESLKVDLRKLKACLTFCVLDTRFKRRRLMKNDWWNKSERLVGFKFQRCSLVHWSLEPPMTSNFLKAQHLMFKHYINMVYLVIYTWLWICSNIDLKLRIQNSIE